MADEQDFMNDLIEYENREYVYLRTEDVVIGGMIWKRDVYQNKRHHPRPTTALLYRNFVSTGKRAGGEIVPEKPAPRKSIRDYIQAYKAGKS